VGGALSYGYKALSDKAALLVTDGPITYRQADDNGPLCNWVTENGKEILRRTRKPKRGVWIVTKTWSANHRRLTVLSNKGTAVTVGIDVQAHNAGQARASASWWREHSDELWNTDHDVSTFGVGSICKSFMLSVSTDDYLSRTQESCFPCAVSGGRRLASTRQK
jgi:hypothetical protein